MIKELRTATKTLHLELEQQLYATKIMAGSLEKQEYIHLLSINHLFFHEFEHFSETISGLDDYKIKKSHLAEMDLSYYNRESMDKQKIEYPTMDRMDKDMYMGLLYVVLGSQLGTAVISKQLKRLDYIPEKARNFYGEGATYLPLWKLFVKTLDTQTEITHRQKAIEGAKYGFYYFSILYHHTLPTIETTTDH